MFSSKKQEQQKLLNPSGRSLIGESLHVEGDLRSPGCVDFAGLINGNVYVNEMKMYEPTKRKLSWRWY